MENEVKFCKDCKYFTVKYVNKITYFYNSCIKKEYMNKGKHYFLNGAMEPTNIFLCREDENKCGIEAKGYEKKKTFWNK